MKHAAKFSAVFCLLLALSGCQSGSTSTPNTSSNTNMPEELKASDYFPKAENTRYVYQGEGNEYAFYDAYPDFTSENQIQLRIDNGGTILTMVIAHSDGKLVQTYSSGETYDRENHLNKTGEEEVLLAEPIAKGTAWTLKDGSTRTITDTSASVSTPSGHYDALEVTTQGPNGTIIQYYAKDIGLIKIVYGSGGSQISSTLSSVEKDVPLTQTVRFFYPNVDLDKIYYEEKEIVLYTNDVTKDVIAKAYREVPNGAAKVFSENTETNSLFLNDDGSVSLDLNQAFLKEMNAGSGYESAILQCIANTFGDYYNTDKVVLTIEGSPYSSGHFKFQEGEFLQADLINAIPLAK